MKIVALLFVGGLVANAARLEKTYLPPGHSGYVGATTNAAGFVRAPGLFNGAYNAQSYGGAGVGSYQDNGSNRRAGQAIAITRYDNQNIGDGTYRYNYQTANGISAEETGANNGNSESVSGSYSYTGTDGLQYTVHYTADENGFHPEGAHLPTPPPIPDDIRRGVELSLASEARGDNQGGQYRPQISSPQVFDNYHTNSFGVGAHGRGYNY